MATTQGLSMQNMNVLGRGNENFTKPVPSKMQKQVNVAGKTRRGLSNVSNKENQVSDSKESVVLKKHDRVENKPVRPITKSKGYSDLKSLALKDANDKKNVEPMDIPDVYTDMVQCLSDTLPPVKDVDKDDLECPMMCAEYVKDVYKYLYSIERKLHVEDYMHQQTEINERMRTILVDWLIQVHQRFSLLQETLYLTVYILDRFLAKSPVNRSKLQLAGVSTMLLASKYEETYAPEIGDFVYITDNAYTKAEIRHMEAQIHKVLDFNLSNPLCLHFLRRNSKIAGADAKKHTLAKYLMELTLPDYEAARCFPSQVAASAFCLACKILDGSEWDATLEYYTGYSEAQLLPCIKKIATLVVKSETSKLQAVRSKYASSKFMKISKIPELKSDIIKSLAEAPL